MYADWSFKAVSLTTTVSPGRGDVLLRVTAAVGVGTSSTNVNEAEVELAIPSAEIVASILNCDHGCWTAIDVTSKVTEQVAAKSPAFEKVPLIRSGVDVVMTQGAMSGSLLSAVAADKISALGAGMGTLNDPD